MSVAEMTDAQIIHKLEAKFGRDLEAIIPAPEEFNSSYNKQGERIFKGLDIGAESIISVHPDGFVMSRAIKSRFADVLGTIS